MISIGDASSSGARSRCSKRIPTSQKAQQASVLLELGRMDFQQGLLDGAKTLYGRALTVAEAANDLFTQGRALYSLGLVSVVQSAFDEAVQQYTRAADAFQTIPNADAAGQAWLARASARFEQRDLPRALEDFTLSVKTFEHTKNQEGLARAYLGLGDDARAAARRRRRRWSTPRVPYDLRGQLGDARRAVAGASRDGGGVAAGRRSGESASGVRGSDRDARSRASRHRRRRGSARAHPARRAVRRARRMARREWRASRRADRRGGGEAAPARRPAAAVPLPIDARTVTRAAGRRAPSAQSARLAAETDPPRTRELARLPLAHGGLASVSRRSRRSWRRCERKRASGSRRSRATCRRSSICAARRSSPRSIRSPPRFLPTPRSSTSSSATIARRSSSPRIRARRATAGARTDGGDDGDANRQAAPRLEVHAFTVALTRQQLAEQVWRYTDGIAKKADTVMADGRALYDLLLAPAADRLAGRTTLVIVPDDALWTLPFEALMPADGRYLIEDAAITLLPSAAAWLSRPEPGGRRAADRHRRDRRSQRHRPVPDAPDIPARRPAAAASRRRSRRAGSRTSRPRPHDVVSSAPASHRTLAAWELFDRDLTTHDLVLADVTPKGERLRLDAGRLGPTGLYWALQVAGARRVIFSRRRRRQRPRQPDRRPHQLGRACRIRTSGRPGSSSVRRAAVSAAAAAAVTAVRPPVTDGPTFSSHLQARKAPERVATYNGDGLGPACTPTN